MRISDWSSDVCSSDLYSSLSLLSPHDRDGIRRSLERAIALHEKRLTRVRVALQQQRPSERVLRFHVDGLLDLGPEHEKVRRADERRVGEEGVSTCRYRGAPAHKKKKKNRRHIEI